MRAAIVSNMRRLAWLFAGAVACTLAQIANASGPVPERWIAPESDWVVHVDAERLSQAEALRPVFDALAASTWGASLTDMGIDARMDLTGITMFGTIMRGPEAPGETTTILQGGAALRTAIQNHVQAHGGYTLVLRRASKADGQGISAWTIDSLSVHVALVPMCQPDAAPADQTLIAILSDNSNRLQSCIGQLMAEKRGEAVAVPPDSQAGAEMAAPLLGSLAPPSGSVVYACARELHQAQPPPRSALLASTDSMQGHLGYRSQGDDLVVFAGMRIHASEDADMDAMLESLDRMVEFWTNRTAELAQRKPAMLEMLKLLQACEISSTGREVSLSMERALGAGEGSGHSPKIIAAPSEAP